MADKKKAGVSVVPEFVAGEQPTADKFNAISVQLERASSELEKSVGDVWGESWPYSTSSTSKLTLPYGRLLTGDGKVNSAYDSFLDIANIARLIGPAANLSPMFPEFFDGEADPIYSVADEVLQAEAADEKKEFWIRFPPRDIATGITFTGTGAPTNRVSSHDNVSSAGDWHLSTDRKLTVFTPVSNVDAFTISYETIPQTWGTGPDVPGSTYNVIPDPNQTANATGIGTQCTATVIADGYSVQLPLAVFGRINNNGTNTNLNGDGDIAKNAQLSLPRVLRDSFSTPGTIIPEGFVYLRDNVTGKLYSDAVYEYNDANTLIVKNVELDVTHGFSIITIGSTITEAIHDLRYKWFRHSHDGTYGEAPIHVSSLAGILESEGDTGIYVTSQIANNWMPQYLHRDGYRADSDANDNNAMRGNIVFGLVDEPQGQRILGVNGKTTTFSRTWGLAWGHDPGYGEPDNSRGPVIYGRGQTGDLVIEMKDDTSSNVVVQGAGSFTSNVKSNVIDATGNNFFYAGGTSVIQSVGDGTLSSSADLLISAEETVTIKVDPSGLGSDQRKIILDCPGWATVPEDGGTTGYYKGVLICDSDSDTGTTMFSNCLFQVRAPNNDGGIVRFDNTSSGSSTSGRILMLRHSDMNASSAGNAYKNFIDFEAGYDSSFRRVGRVESRPTSAAPRDAFFCEDGSGSYATGGIDRWVQRSGDVAYISGSQDFGELVPAGDVEEWKPEIKSVPENNILGLSEGMVVFVREKKFWRKGPGTPMVVTNRAILIGNACDETESEVHEVLSFIGQVPVWVEGSVKTGDYLVPTEKNCCVGIDPNEISFTEYKNAIGTAWESTESEVSERFNSKVLCAIGVK